MDVARANRALSPLLRWVKAVVTYGAYRYSHESAYRPIHNKLGLHKAAQWQRPAKDLKVGRKDQGTAFSLLEAQMDRWRSIVTADNWASKDPVEARRKDNLPNP